jgi:hypothetical protein
MTIAATPPTRLITEQELKTLTAAAHRAAPRPAESKRHYPPRSASYFEASVMSRCLRRN